MAAREPYGISSYPTPCGSGYLMSNLPSACGANGDSGYTPSEESSSIQGSESSAIPSVSEPSSTAIRVWVHGITKAVGDPPGKQWSPAPSFSEEDSFIDPYQQEGSHCWQQRALFYATQGNTRPRCGLCACMASTVIVIIALLHRAYSLREYGSPVNSEEGRSAAAGFLVDPLAKDDSSSLGMYRIVYDQFLPVDQSFARTSTVVGDLSAGDLVNVVEVSRYLDKGRVRARIESPPGWISLRYSGGTVFAKKENVLAGHWKTKAGIIVAVTDPVVVMSSGKRGKVTADGRDSFSLKIDGKVDAGDLVDGTLVWNSGDVWTRSQVAPTCVFALLAQHGSSTTSAGDTSAQMSAEATTCSAAVLFKSAEVHAAVAEGVLQAGKSHGLLDDEDRPKVWEEVVAGFRKIIVRLAERAPLAASALQRVHLTRHQGDAILKSFRLASDPRVQSLGLDVAIAIRDSGCTLRECVRQHVELKLRPRQDEIQRLRDALVSPALRKAWHGGRTWEASLDSENVHFLASVMGNFTGEGGLANNLVRHMTVEQKRSVISGGVLQSGRFLLEAVRAFAWPPNLAEKLRAPLWATSIHGTWGDYGSELVSCAQGIASQGTVHFLQELLCPLKFGSQGLEALQADMRTNKNQY